MSVLFAVFGMGYWELLIVAGIMLLLFGHRLPSMMRSMGRGVTEFKKGLNEIEDEIDRPIDEKKRKDDE